MTQDTGPDLEPHTIETTTGKVTYIAAGRGPVALFIDGLLSGYAWLQHPEAIPARFRYISAKITAPQLQDQDPCSAIAVDARAAILAEFLDLIGVELVDLFSDKAGAASALAFALNHREKIRSLHVVSAPVPQRQAPLYEC
jgi:pimeloyl-ACP methyl ester carboxylesterase